MKRRALNRTTRNVTGNSVFGRGFLVTVTAVKTLYVKFFPKSSARFPRTIFIVLFFRINRLFRKCTRKGDHSDVSRLVGVQPSITGIREGKGMRVISPRRIGVKRAVMVHPKRGIPLSNVIIRKDSTLGAVTLAKRDVPQSLGRNSAVVSNYVGLSKMIHMHAAGDFNRDAMSGVVSLMRDTSGGGSGDRTFVAHFTQICAPVIIFTTVTLTIVPPFLTTAKVMNRKAFNRGFPL